MNNGKKTLDLLKLRVIENIRQGVNKKNLKGTPDQLLELKRMSDRILADMEDKRS